MHPLSLFLTTAALQSSSPLVALSSYSVCKTTTSNYYTLRVPLILISSTLPNINTTIPSTLGICTSLTPNELVQTLKEGAEIFRWKVKAVVEEKDLHKAEHTKGWPIAGMILATVLGLMMAIGTWIGRTKVLRLSLGGRYLL
jgi:hypothetical protein